MTFWRRGWARLLDRILKVLDYDYFTPDMEETFDMVVMCKEGIVTSRSLRGIFPREPWKPGMGWLDLLVLDKKGYATVNDGKPISKSYYGTVMWFPKDKCAST